MANLDKQIAALDRQLKALQLRKEGVSYEDIKTKLKFASTGAACNAVKAALKRVTYESVAELREVEAARLDDLWKKGLEVLMATHPVLFMGAPIEVGKSGKGKPKNFLKDPTPTLKAIDTLTKLSARRAALFGLDVPKVVGVVDSENKADWKAFITDALGQELDDQNDYSDALLKEGDSADGQ